VGRGYQWKERNNGKVLKKMKLGMKEKQERRNKGVKCIEKN
jgi:hypothetical protein